MAHNLSIKLSELAIREWEGEERENLIVDSVDEKAKTETTTNLDCTTPTAKENKIPDVMTCPPAPKKRKASLAVGDNASNKVMATKEFFDSPVLDVMFDIGINKVSSKVSGSTPKRHR
ncbi:hypothetical protein JCGZ_14128 [Jatropha curcas]|uniref:Uncharacterized protein n=2 Tax=Jatropha curcas TaxID=180498 RepID=A0A067JWV3_JATCU|nr:hypothetical protein JCGZ_14128 [Jatropha curcas]